MTGAVLVFTRDPRVTDHPALAPPLLDHAEAVAAYRQRLRCA